jgi:DNA ligase-associated metallophosphoesterase
MASPVYHTIHDNTFWLLSQKALYWEEERTLILSDLHLGKTGHFRKEGVPVPQGVYKNDLHRLFHIIQHYKPEQLIIAGDMFHSKMNKEVDLFTRWRKDIAQLHIQLIKGNHDILHNDHYAEADITVTDCSLQVGRFCFVHDIEDIKGGKKFNEESHNPLPVDDKKKKRTRSTKKDCREDDMQSINKKEQLFNSEADKITVGNPQSAIVNPQSVTANPQSTYYFSGHIHPGIVVRSGSRQSTCLPCYYFAADYAVLPAFSAFTGLYPISPKKNEHVFAIVNDVIMKMR